MIDRPDYISEDEWAKECRAAKKPKPADGELRARRKPLNDERNARSNGEAVEGTDAPELSEDTLALAFADRHANGLRYVAAWGKWLAWTGTHWEFESTLDVFDKARKICREAAQRCTKPPGFLARAKTVTAVEMLARSDRRIAATVEQWDADPWALNTPGGIVDLKTGLIRPHCQTDYVMKITTNRAANARSSLNLCIEYSGASKP